MSILFGIGFAMGTLFVLVTAWFMWSEKDVLQGIVWSFLSAFLLIKWYGVIFNG